MTNDDLTQKKNDYMNQQHILADMIEVLSAVENNAKAEFTAGLSFALCLSWIDAAKLAVVEDETEMNKSVKTIIGDIEDLRAFKNEIRSVFEVANEARPKEEYGFILGRIYRMIDKEIMRLEKLETTEKYERNRI